jgi:hypothetical protein
MIPELPGAVPEIPVSDITAATMYYRDNLSFSVDWVEPTSLWRGSRGTTVGCSSPVLCSARSVETSAPC